MTRHPDVAVGAVVVDGNDLLLVRRGRGAAQGRWSVPGGRIEFGETAAEAVIRELHEETGLVGLCGDFLGWVELIDDEHHHVVLDFDVVVLDRAEPRAGGDAAEARWVDVIEVCDLELAPGMIEFLHDVGVVPTIT